MVIDAFLASHEIEMVRYRLALHAPIVGRTIIAESNYTYTAEPKPTYVRNALTREEIVKYNIRLVFIEFPPHLIRVQQQCATGFYQQKGKRIPCGHYENFQLEQWSRRTVNQAILEEIALLNAAITGRQLPGRIERSMDRSDRMGSLAPATPKPPTPPPPPPELFVYFSDVDELLDARMLGNLSHRFPSCMGVRQKVFMYNERCYMRGTRWIRAIIARADWLARVITKFPNLELRLVHEGMRDLVKEGCYHMPLAFPHIGWHLTYFMRRTWEIVNKMRSNSHARQRGLFRGLPDDWREREASEEHEAGYEIVLRQKISTCTPFSVPACWTVECNQTARRPYAQAVDLGAVPPLAGWPRHPEVDADEIARACEADAWLVARAANRSKVAAAAARAGAAARPGAAAKEAKAGSRAAKSAQPAAKEGTGAMGPRVPATKDEARALVKDREAARMRARLSAVKEKDGEAARMRADQRREAAAALATIKASAGASAGAREIGDGSDAKVNRWVMTEDETAATQRTVAEIAANLAPLQAHVDVQ